MRLMLYIFVSKFGYWVQVMIFRFIGLKSFNKSILNPIKVDPNE